MITKEMEYKAQVFQIGGFAMMSPFGRIILQPIVVFDEFNDIKFFLYVIFSFLLFIIGLFHVEKGRAILYQSRGLRDE